MAVQLPTTMRWAGSIGHSMSKQRPELFARALRGAKRELDPKGIMNPGVLIDP